MYVQYEKKGKVKQLNTGQTLQMSSYDTFILF